jgi:hypothetical protein
MLEFGRGYYLKSFDFYLLVCAMKLHGKSTSRAIKLHNGMREDSLGDLVATVG